MKAIRILRRNFIYASKSILRNLSLSLASIICTSITLILVSVAIIISANVNEFTKEIEQEITMVVFVDRNATQEEIDNLQLTLKDVENVEEVTYKSKEEIKQEMMQESEAFETIMSKWTDETNPLQAEYVIKVSDVRLMSEVKESISGIEKVDNVNYGEDMVEQIVSVFDIVEKVSVAIILALIVVTIFLICNTIKLTIFSRKSEIEIMRLVGTSNTVIKLPFVIEGLFLGILGSIIPIIATIYAYVIANDKLGGYFITNLIKMINPFPFVIYLSLTLLLIGIVVGMFGSYRSVRKYLKI